MRNEQLKYFTAVITIAAASLTFFLFSEKTGFLFLDEKYTILLIGIASAYAAFFSLYLSRRLEKQRMSKRIFIIYSHKDRDSALALAQKLKEKGYNPWIDELEIIPGQNWNKAILQAIERSSIAIYLCSKNTEGASGFINKEMKSAMELLRATREAHSPIIPVYLEESSLPTDLADIHAVKLYEDGGFEKLEKGLEYMIGKRT